MRGLITGTALLIAAVALSGCGSVLELVADEPPRLFRLTPKSSFDAEIPSVQWQLVVEPPSAPASINSNRIGLVLEADQPQGIQSDLQFTYFANANWVDRAPIMVQRLIIESFDNSKKIIGVGPETIGVRPNFVLKPELREFQAINEGASQRAHVRINARLIKLPERRIVAVESFDHSHSVPAGQLYPVIDAFDIALGKVMKRLVVWTLEQGDAVMREAAAQQPESESTRVYTPTTHLTRPITRLPRPVTK